MNGRGLFKCRYLIAVVLWAMAWKVFIPLALANLGTAAIAGGQTASSFLASFLGQVGSDTAAATSDNTAQQATLTQLTTQQDSLSGVSLDEEASNLTQYQRAYQAAAQVFNIGNSVMASALNLGVETTVT